MHATTGRHCPGCGILRATHALLHGRIAEAASLNLLWFIALPLVGYVGVSEWLRFWRGRPLTMGPLERPWTWVAIGTLALGFTVLRNLNAEPWRWLAP